MIATFLLYTSSSSTGFRQMTVPVKDLKDAWQCAWKEAQLLLRQGDTLTSITLAEFK